MSPTIQVILLITMTLYNAIASLLEDRQPPLGQLINLGKHRLQFKVASRKI